MQQILFVIKAIILGIVEGVTEFLPVSSTGHLIIFSKLLGMPDDEFMKMFIVVVQLGAILAVVFLFWKKLWAKIKLFFRGDSEGVNFVKVWVLGCVPAAVLGFLFDDLIDKYLFSVTTVAIALIIGAALLLVLEQIWAKHRKKTDLNDITTKDALIVGAWQCISMWPGFSRSAATIMGGWHSGMTTALAAEYSFFLAIPIMFGASGLKLVKFEFAGIQVYQYFALIMGFAVAFVTAMLVVKAFMDFVRQKPLKVFSFYRLGLGILLIILIIAKAI